jgi:hypothetical protein
MSNTYNIPPEMREMAAKSIENTKKAFDGYFEAANKATADMTKSHGAVGEKITDNSKAMLEQAKKNVEASLDYAQRLSLARSVEEIWAIQNEFIRSQSAEFMTQSQNMGGVIQEQVKNMSKGK